MLRLRQGNATPGIPAQSDSRKAQRLVIIETAEAVSSGRCSMSNKCSECGTRLNQYHPGKLCYACQKKRTERLTSDELPHYDALEMARILGLDSAEQVKRLGRKNKLPPRIPSIRRWLWSKEVVDRWIKSEGQLPEGSVEQLAALADAHGGLHYDEATGQWKMGRPEVITPVVSDREGSRIEIYTEFIPDHAGSP